jgi:hypothetical protein
MNWTYLIAVILNKDKNIKNFMQTNINIHTHDFANKIDSNQAIKNDGSFNSHNERCHTR